MMNEFFTASYQKMSANGLYRVLTFVLIFALLMGVKSIFQVMATSVSFMPISFAAFVVLSLAIIFEVTALFDYYNTEFGWAPGIKIRD